MISSEAIQKICSEYGIGNYISLDKINQGVLNDNYLLETSMGKYFIKSVREKAKDRIDNIYSVESFMKEKDIPAIVMMKTKSGNIFLEDENSVYTVYPFLEADTSLKYSKSEYSTVGEMLGKIHVAGGGDITGITDVKKFKRQNDEVILERLEGHKDFIEGKSSLDETDKQFLEYIDFKLKIYPKIKKTELQSDTLIHGDYHRGNLLFDKKTREIIGVCDWEKTEFAPRSYELSRSIFYSCLQDEENFEDGLDNAKSFLNGYLSVYPMQKSEVIDGMNMRVHRMALSGWIEEKYYKNNDDRANKFISKEMRMLDNLINRGLLERIKEILNTETSLK